MIAAVKELGDDIALNSIEGFIRQIIGWLNTSTASTGGSGPTTSMKTISMTMPPCPHRLLGLTPR